MRPKTLLFILVFFVFSCQTTESPLFTLTKAKDTGIHFSNDLVESEDYNILSYLYYYNGAGVSAGDINNDGLCDLYFVSNQGENKLFLNKGLKNGIPNFEDISNSAGVEGYSNFQTGVTMADINGDGLLDIYVCAVGDYKAMKGKNELYINSGNNSFTEQAEEYGLDFVGFSTQAGFFDYDKDGDLDCFLLNHAVHNTAAFDNVSKRKEFDAEAGDYLFRNDGNKFTDISKEAGVFQAPMGYGLGLGISDLNNDGWEDIYVGNDFHEDDYYYINQKDGTFKEELKDHFQHTSRFSMGCDIADINNDGLADIMSLDMYPESESVEKTSAGEEPLDIFIYKRRFGYYKQYTRNCLQLNFGGERFADIGIMAGVAATDWSWSTLIADYDGDGHKDIFIANGIIKRPNDLDFLKYVNSKGSAETAFEKTIENMPSGIVSNYLYKGNEKLAFEDKSLEWGFNEETASNGATYADLDNDGDLDLITNNLNQNAGIYLNNATKNKEYKYTKLSFLGEGKNTNGIGAKVLIYSAGKSQYQQLMPTRGFMSSVEPKLTFGLGNWLKIDSLKVIWPSFKTQTIISPEINKELILKEGNASPSPIVKPGSNNLFSEIVENELLTFKHKENEFFDFSQEKLVPFKLSSEGPKVVVGDVDKNGLEDIYICGAESQLGQLFLQTKKGFLKKEINSDSTIEETNALFFDANNDGNLDLYVVSGGNQYCDYPSLLEDRLYLNDGNANFKLKVNALPKLKNNKSVVLNLDIDEDGDQDLFVGGRSVCKGYGQSSDSYLLINDGTGKFSNQTAALAPDLLHLGMVTDGLFSDFDKDGDTDLTLVGDWMGVLQFENKGGTFSRLNSELTTATGFWNSISTADFDKDGDLDYIVGNLGTNTKLKKEVDGQLKMYIKDFDSNGAKEQLIAYNRGNNWFPVNNKDELGAQMPSIINKKFTNYKAFAGKTVQEIVDLENSELKQINTFESCYFENVGNGKYKKTPLPMLAQTSKVMCSYTEDLNNDGYPDIVLAGNFNGASVYQGQYDSSFGVVLINNKKGGFNALPSESSGLVLKGDIRDIKKIKIGERKYYLFARNNDTVQLFSVNP